MIYLVEYHCPCGRWHSIGYPYRSRAHAQGVAEDLLADGASETTVAGPFDLGELFRRGDKMLDRYEMSRRGELIHHDYGLTCPEGLSFLEKKNL